MILRRLTANLRAQNWTAITIEFLIVILGVFLGTQVANWNQARLEKIETERMLVHLVPELKNQLEFYDSARTYYATTRRYADQALAAWKDDRSISDEQFVIAAYQASQIIGIGTNAENWALTFGGEQLRNIDDPKVRRNLEVVLTTDYGAVQFTSVATPYREQVRRVIPIRVQDQIRAKCGDRTRYGEGGYILTELPQDCMLRIPAGEAAAIAAALRARRDLPAELYWHLAAVAAYLANALTLEEQIRTLQRDLTKAS